ncbi:ABC transporter permease [Candidatus Poribacteria bacterium]
MKYILKMAFRNVGRNKRRTMLSAIAIAVAVMVVLFMRGYIGGVTDSMFDSLVKIQTGHIKIMHSEYYDREDMMPLEHMVDGFDGDGYKQLIPILESVEGVNIVAPRIKFGVLLSFQEKSRMAMGIGIDPQQEDAVSYLSKTMVEGQYLGDNTDLRSMIIGGGLADKLGIKLGDKLTVVSRTAYDSMKGMTFKVTGIFRYGISSLDSKLFYVPIGAAARLLEMGDGASELIVMVDRPENAEKIADAIKVKFQEGADRMSALPEGNPADDGASAYAVISWQQQEGILAMFKSGISMYRYFYIGLMILASTVIINTTMMVIYERTREIGTIGALGMSSGQIVLLFVIEAMIISAIGSFMGTIVGGGFDLLLSKTGINFNALSGGSVDMVITDIVYPHFGLSILVGSFLFGVVIASAIAYIPARRAAKIEPVEALRSI